MKNSRILFNTAKLIGVIGLVSLGSGFLGWNYFAAEKSPTDYLGLFSIGMWVGTAFLLTSSLLFIIASMQGGEST